MITAITRDSKNAKHYEDVVFPSMSDSAFEDWLKDLNSGDKCLTVVIPHDDNKMTVEGNFELADKLGISFFQPLIYGANGDRPSYMTPNEYLVINTIIRKTAQSQDAKMNVAQHNRAVDQMSGQVTGVSKSSALSYPETQSLTAAGYKAIPLELLKFRGGDVKANNAYNNVLSSTGAVSLSAITPFAGGVKGKKMLHDLMVGMMLENNL
jgi:hypothetical protein